MIRDLTHIDRGYCWPNGGSRGAERMAKAKIRWFFWADSTLVGQSYCSNVKLHSFSTFQEACKAYAALLTQKAGDSKRAQTRRDR